MNAQQISLSVVQCEFHYKKTNKSFIIDLFGGAKLQEQKEIIEECFKVQINKLTFTCEGKSINPTTPLGQLFPANDQLLIEADEIKKIQKPKEPKKASKKEIQRQLQQFVDNKPFYDNFKENWLQSFGNQLIPTFDEPKKLIPTFDEVKPLIEVPKKAEVSTPWRTSANIALRYNRQKFNKQ